MNKLTDTRAQKEITNSEIVYPGIVWDIQQDTVQFAPHSSFKRDFIKHTGAAAVLAFDQSGKLILIKQYRHPAGAYFWEIPAGLLDQAREDPMLAAKRELFEETDYQAGEIAPLITYFPTPGSSNEQLHIFVAKNCIKQAQNDFLKEAEEAELEVATFEFSAVLNAILAGKLKNGPLMTAVLAYAAKNKEN